ncbi:MAG TPA: membrane dipeptidase [Thermoguttaceae bacterium]|nr:membrane dipeptidase [Thermoguttaceae bacterium]
MHKPGPSRRDFLCASLVGVGAGAAAVAGTAQPPIVDPAERVSKCRLRPAVRDRILAGHRAILDELKPTKAQLDRGLQLHYTSCAADAQGGISLTYPGGLIGDRLAADKGLDRQKAMTFQAAYDPQWIEESRALYEIAGVQLGLEDVAHPDDNTFDKALHLLARSTLAYDQRQDLDRVVSWETIESGRREGRPCIVQHLAATGCFADAEDPIYQLDLFFAFGVRMSQLTYIQKNPLCCSWLQRDDAGLTDLGKRVVRRMNELGILVDLAHCGHRTSHDVIEASLEPPLISHTACKAIYDDATNENYLDAVFAQPYARGVPRPDKTGSRHAADDTLRALAAKGGLAAFYFIHYMLDAEGSRSFSAWYRHLEHAIEVAGIDHVGIGTDLGFFPGWQASPLDWTNWPYWTVGLVCKGLSDEEIRNVIGGNYLDHVRRVLNKRPWGEFL